MLIIYQYPDTAYEHMHSCFSGARSEDVAGYVVIILVSPVAVVQSTVDMSMWWIWICQAVAMQLKA